MKQNDPFTDLESEKMIIIDKTYKAHCIIPDPLIALSFYSPIEDKKRDQHLYEYLRDNLKNIVKNLYSKDEIMTEEQVKNFYAKETMRKSKLVFAVATYISTVFQFSLNDIEDIKKN